MWVKRETPPPPAPDSELAQWAQSKLNSVQFRPANRIGHSATTKHEQVECDECDKHENLKLYCHFHNNNKVCPHEGFCKYMENCVREYCMYKYESADIDVKLPVLLNELDSI